MRRSNDKKPTANHAQPGSRSAANERPSSGGEESASLYSPQLCTASEMFQAAYVSGSPA